MAIYEDLVSKARLKTFLDEIKKHFPVSVNGKKQDSNGNIVIPNFGGASASSNGTSGMVPAPLKGQQDKVLKGDGTWDIVSIAGGGTGANTVAAAVKALFGSSAVGSSTKSIYYDGATLKACADSIGGGGIVAQLLEQNGYVKFANGLILQWGVYTTGTRNVTITLPIATSVTYAVIAVARTTNSIGCSGSQCCQYVSNVTSTDFQAGSYDTGNGYAGFWWMSIGKI